MRVLYYCPEYHCRHGGRAHARGFFGALKKLSSVSAYFLYPKKGPKDNLSNEPGNKTSKERSWFLPQMPRRVIHYFRPKPALTRNLIEELIVNRCDTLVIRIGTGLPSIRKIKKTCPDVAICLEINSAFFDESFHELPLRSLFQKWEVKRFARADAIAVVSSYLKNYLVKRGVAPDKILVNQNGVDADAMHLCTENDIRVFHGIPEKAFLLGYIGGMEPFRRLPEVVAHIAELRRRGHEDIYFMIVGDGEDMPAVKDTIARYYSDLSDKVKLVGWQEHSEIPKFLSAFDVAIFPFTNDYCSPLKLFEYLGYGLPTIGPNTSAVGEIFEDGVHLKMVEQDGLDFVSTILLLKNNPALRRSLGQKGKELVLSEYTWTKNAERVVEHIQRMRETANRRNR